MVYNIALPQLMVKQQDKHLGEKVCLRALRAALVQFSGAVYQQGLCLWTVQS